MRSSRRRVWVLGWTEWWGALCAMFVAPTLIAALWLIPAAASQAQESDPAGLNAELLRQVEAAAQLDREKRTERQRQAHERRENDQRTRDEATQNEQEQTRAAAAPLEKALSDRQLEQTKLLRAIRGDTDVEHPVVRTPTSSSTLTDPRTASTSPTIRALPEDIFDRSQEIIAAGTWGNDSPLSVTRLTLDADGDGHPELIRFVDRRTGKLVRQEEDRNYDGILDAWTLYQEGAPTQRALDGNDDGNPDAFESYQNGRVAIRELDRDDDGIRDVFYRYRGETLAEEKHDANNDGMIDLIIFYEERLRVRSEEDRDRDGRMDLWTNYINEAGLEKVARIERDRQGTGVADVVDFFESQNGSTVLIRREEDLNEDGLTDIVSFYVGGRLKRRQIRDTEINPL